MVLFKGGNIISTLILYSYKSIVLNQENPGLAS